MPEKNWDRVPIDAQSVDAPLSRAAIFLVVTVASEPTTLSQRSARCSMGSTISSRPSDFAIFPADYRASSELVAICGIVYISISRPLELKPFAPIKGPVHAAPSTPGDLLFHIRSERPDLCFEFERILLDSLGAGVTVIDEVSGFRYFDARDLLGFVDGTANPTGLDLPASALVGDEDADFAGGSYVVVQKYLHDLTAGRRFPRPFRRRSSVERR